jgi:hypothetical protein
MLNKFYIIILILNNKINNILLINQHKKKYKILKNLIENYN